MVWMYHSLLHHSIVRQHLGFQILAIMNKVAINIRVCVGFF